MIALGQHLVLPVDDTERLIETSAQAGFNPMSADATAKLAQRMANEIDEEIVVVKIVKLISPQQRN